MEYKKFGNTGLRVSQVCLGTMGFGSSNWREWVLNAGESAPILQRALELGVNFFDMANFYSLGENERIVGRALLSQTRRDNLVLASKVYYAMSDDPNDQGLSRKHILSAIDGTLERIGTDYLDLYIVHAFDENTPVEETMCALNDVVRAGKARYIGASTMYAWQFAKMNAAARQNGWTTFSNMQCQLNLVYREEEREMIPYCRDQGIAVSTFSPLARGFLAGVDDVRAKSDTFTADFYGDEVDLAIAARLREVAANRSANPSDIALAWVAGSPHSDVPLIGVQNTAQLEAALRASNMVLTPQENEYLEELYRPRDVINDANPLNRKRALPKAITV